MDRLDIHLKGYFENALTLTATGILWKQTTLQVYTHTALLHPEINMPYNPAHISRNNIRLKIPSEYVIYYNRHTMYVMMAR